MKKAFLKMKHKKSKLQTEQINYKMYFIMELPTVQINA
jgi:hypothetical protein